MRANQEFRLPQKMVRPSPPEDSKDVAQVAERGSEAHAGSESSRSFRGGTGGAWRLFIRERTLGSRQKPDFRTLASEYRDLDPEARASLQARADAAGARRRAGAPHSFGETARQAEQRAAKRKAAQLADDVLSHKRRRVDELAVCPASLIPSAFDLGADPSESPWARLLALKKALRVEGQAKARGDAQARADVQQFMDGDGQRSVREARPFSETLFREAADFISRPKTSVGVNMQTFEWNSLEVVRQVRDALSGPKNPDHQTLLQLFQQVWAKLHETIDFRELPHVFDKKAEAVPLCRMAGVCVCGPRGTKMRKFIASLHKFLKAECPPKTPARLELAHGSFSILLIGQSRADVAEEAPDELWNDVLLPNVPIHEARWLHIGHQMLTPFKTSVQQVKGPTPGGADPQPPQAATVEATCRFNTQWQMAAELDLEAVRWVGAMYVADFHAQPVASITPSLLEVRRRGETRLLWCPWGKPPRRRQHLGVDVGWGDVMPPSDDERDDEGAAPAEEDDVDALSDASLCEDLDAAADDALAGMVAGGSEGAVPVGEMPGEMDLLHVDDALADAEVADVADAIDAALEEALGDDAPPGDGAIVVAEAPLPEGLAVGDLGEPPLPPPP